MRTRRARVDLRPGIPRAAGVGILALVVASGFLMPGAATEARTRATPAGTMAAFDAHVRHIVVVVMENHAYDTDFGTYCLALSKYCLSTGAGIPNGTCVPLNASRGSTPCSRPFDFTPANDSTVDLAHDWKSTHRSIDGGRMDGFYGAEGRSNTTFGHYNGSTVPVYWDLAEEYGLADGFFSSAASWSLPNHWYVVSSTPPAVSFQNDPGLAPMPIRHAYLNESNQTYSIESALLNHTHVSWRYYDWKLPTYAKAINSGGTMTSLGKAYDFWSPLAARAQSYQANVSRHFVARSQFLGDAANGTLPNLSWVIPPLNASDHPPYNVTAAQDYVAEVANAVEASPEWNTTLLLVTWDEYGGFYDHVAPPTLDADGAGMRVPLLVIGPYVKEGSIDHASMNFGSLLHLMEARFGLGCEASRDCNATLPLALFNFSRTARLPIYVPYYGNATYPMPLQSSGKLPGPTAGRSPSPPPVPQPPSVRFGDGGAS